MLDTHTEASTHTHTWHSHTPDTHAHSQNHTYTFTLTTEDPFYRYVFYNITEDFCVSTFLANRGLYEHFLSNRGPTIVLSNRGLYNHTPIWKGMWFATISNVPQTAMCPRFECKFIMCVLIWMLSFYGGKSRSKQHFCSSIITAGRKTTATWPVLWLRRH